jgi:hypothetical protein
MIADNIIEDINKTIAEHIISKRKSFDITNTLKGKRGYDVGVETIGLTVARWGSKSLFKSPEACL